MRVKLNEQVYLLEINADELAIAVNEGNSKTEEFASNVIDRLIEQIAKM
jgi:hypothetical protein